MRRLGRSGGTYVGSPRVVECDLAAVIGFSEQMRRSGLAPGARVVSAERRRALGTSLRRWGSRRGHRRSVSNGCAPGTGSRWRSRSRGSRLACSPSCWRTTSWARSTPCSRVGAGARPVFARRSSRSWPARARGRRCSTPPPGAPLMLVTRTALDAAGTPVEYARDLFRADRTRLILWTAEVSRLTLRRGTTHPAGSGPLARGFVAGLKSVHRVSERRIRTRCSRRGPRARPPALGSGHPLTAARAR